MRTRFLCVGLVALLVFAVPGSSAGAGGKFEIVPGESIGVVAIDDTRRSVERQLGKPVDHTNDEQFYSSVYRYPKRDRIGNRGGKLIIVFDGLSRRGRAGYMLTLEPSLGTKQGLGVSDTYSELLGAYPGVSCYHVESDGSRNPNIESNENFECELVRNGGFTYFGFASLDADPEQRIGGLAVSAIQIDP